MRKNSGSNTDPCGTPVLIDSQLEDWPFKTTLTSIMENLLNPLKSIPVYPIVFKFMKDLHARLCQIVLINLEKHLLLLGKD